MKTIVLDDDPTGTQSATGVAVLLESSADLLADALRAADSVYVQTNSRALHEADAVELVRRIRADGEEAARRVGDAVRFVLRGDSTLRGHVFAESEVFLEGDAVMLFVPAFPDGGRTTSGGVHYVRVDGATIPADQSEYAADPVFPFSTAVLADYVAEKSGRRGIPVAVADVRAGRVQQALREAGPGDVIVPDAETDDDIRLIAAAVDAAIAAGTPVVVRCAAPLAAQLAGVASQGLLTTLSIDGVPIEAGQPTLLVVGSHTAGATAQLAPVVARWGDPTVVDTGAAMADPATEGRHVAAVADRVFAAQPLVVISSDRVRSAEHGTLDHGERVMAALTTAVRELLPRVSVVIAKGGITSAEVARTGIGASRAVVLGQVLPGVSVWSMDAHDGRQVLYVVVPGNVGGPDTLTRVLAAVGLD